MKASCDPQSFKDIKQIHDYHEAHKQATAFTKASYMVPLNFLNFSPWDSDGFTVTAWINMASQHGKQKVRSDNSSESEEVSHGKTKPEKVTVT